ncbi:hypothetical protein EV368DRAFT_63023 [Lentinula lateritia]|nr:hypothetical protein EV368DRAFT_63023 [Lentinula lateritia]
MKFLVILIASAALATVTNALPVRLVEREPTRHFQGSMPPPNSPHLANGSGNGSDTENDSEIATESYTINTTSATASSTFTTSIPPSTTADETVIHSSSTLSLPVGTLLQTQSIALPTSTGRKTVVDASGLAEEERVLCNYLRYPSTANIHPQLLNLGEHALTEDNNEPWVTLHIALAKYAPGVCKVTQINRISCNLL